MTPKTRGELAAIDQELQREIESAQSCDEKKVEHWTKDADGFALVNGEYAPGGYNMLRIKAQQHSAVPCQWCHMVNIKMPLALFVRFESALDRLMYWFRFDPAFKRQWHCLECQSEERR